MATNKKVVYNYGDIKIDFTKERYLRKWERVSSKKPAYTDDIQDIVKDLESQDIVGDFVIRY